jgi:hypothetical protein
MNTNSPNYLVVGAMKAGTSALALNLSKHPDVFCMTPYWKNKAAERYGYNLSDYKGQLTNAGSKEMDFFNHSDNFNLGVPFYESFFPLNKTAIGEVSPNYFPVSGSSAYGDCVDNIKNTYPNMKIIAVLRDPINRAFSHWNQIQSTNPSWGTRFYGKSFNQATEQTPVKNGILNRGKYASHLKLYIEAFGSDNVHVELQEDLLNSPLAPTNRIYEFLGVDTLDSDPGFRQVFTGSYSNSPDSDSIDFLTTEYKTEVDEIKTLFPDKDYSLWRTY